MVTDRALELVAIVTARMLIGDAIADVRVP
jgi:hypothetical protein